VKEQHASAAGEGDETKSDCPDLTRNARKKGLAVGLGAPGGRNNRGRQTSRFMGGGHKRLFRIIDFRRDKSGISATVAAIEYDPNRTARIALLHYADGEKRYILAPNGLQAGAKVMSGPATD